MARCQKVCGSQSRSSPFCSSPRWSSAWCGTGGDGSACCPLLTLPHPLTAPAGIPPRRASRSQSRQHLRRPPRPPGPRRSASTPVGCRPSATTPPSRGMRPNARSPTYGCPNRGRTGSPPEPVRRRSRSAVGRPRRRRASRLRPMSAPSRLRRPAGAPARTARQVPERVRPQHARPARRRRPRRGLLGGRRGHPADRRPRARSSPTVIDARCAHGWPAAACAPRPTPARCCGRC